MLRRTLADLKDTTLKQLEEVLAPYLENDLVVQNKGDSYFKFWNGSEILYRGLEATGSTDKDRKKFFSAEYGVIAVDEAREMKEQDFLDLDTRLRRRLPSGEFPPFYFLMATNPTQNWIKSRFILKKVDNPEDYVFIPALPSDNPHLPEGYVDQLRANFSSEPDLVDAYLNGSWDCAEEPNKIIKWEWVKQAIGKDLPRIYGNRVLACDVAAMGDDETVIYYGEGGQVIDAMIYKGKTTMETAGNLAFLARKHGVDVVILDAIGVGTGCFEQTRNLLEGVRSHKSNPVKVIGFGAKQTEKEKESVRGKFNNLKSLAWWKLRGAFKEQRISIPNDDILHAELADVEFNTNYGKITIESKEKYKERNRKSPDRADTLVMFNYANDIQIQCAHKDYGRVKSKLHERQRQIKQNAKQAGIRSY